MGVCTTGGGHRRREVRAIGARTDLGPSRHVCARFSALVALFTACACASEPEIIPGTAVSMRFDAVRDLYAAPFPSEHLRGASGRPWLAAFPNPNRVDLVDAARALIESDADGFGLTSAIYLRTDAPLDPMSLPTLAASTTDAAPIYVVGVDPGRPDYGVRVPISARFLEDPGPFGAPNLLALLPLQGRPLHPKTTYAAVVRRDVRDAAGAELGVSRAMAELAAGVRPAGLSEAAHATYARALDALVALGEDRARIAGLAVFTTGDPAAQLSTLLAAALDAPLPEPEGPLALGEIFSDYCVYSSTIAMPDHQSGVPPFSAEGGAILVDDAGRPILQRRARSRLVVTVPRSAMPARGYPAVVFIRTGGGGDRPLVDRGVRAIAHGPGITPGTGPAEPFARAGFAGVSVDGPNGGLRNPQGADEQFLVINVFNPVALRDNLRQSALELALLAHVLDQLTVDVSGCPGATVGGGGPARFDTETLALMGHSMGATIAPLVLAIEPRYRAAILSGAGGSWIENVVHKKSPIDVSAVARLVLGYEDEGRAIVEHDPALTLVQWAGEAADPPVYGRAIITEAATPRHVLMFQGIVDTYILPPIANATSLSLGLDLARPVLEDSLSALLAISGRREVELPTAGNVDGTTAVVVQVREDGIEDGHEVVFQTEAPKHQYRCFLESFARGEAPRVPAADAPCEGP
ncbi:hypothetical protein L6R52_17405 [Myxococcota bacterium]|nr:hypothetical protein [Myxococcota bacterium]